MSRQLKKRHNGINSILILLGVIAGVLFGIFFPNFMMSTRWIGEVFFNLLKMLVLPLIFSALVSAITSMGGLKKLGSLGFYSFAYVLISVSTSVLIGLTLFNFFTPGTGINPSLIASATDMAALHKVPPMTFETYITSLFPSNILDSIVKFQILPVVIFAVMFSIACSSLGDSAKSIVNLMTEIKNIFIRMITWVISLSPIGIFSLLGTGVAESVEKNHFIQDLYGLGLFVAVFFCGLFLQFIWQLLAVKLIAKKAAKIYLKNVSYALATAFGTSSSLATLPISMDVAQKENVREDVNRFVLPFTSTINLGSTIMYEASAALFFNQILGRHLTIWEQIIIFIVSMIAGMGATGIPESGLITMITVLRSVNVPTSAISVLLPIDRILDRFRTAVNTFGNICCACVVDELVKRHEQRKLNATGSSKSEKVA